MENFGMLPWIHLEKKTVIGLKKNLENSRIFRERYSFQTTLHQQDRGTGVDRP